MPVWKFSLLICCVIAAAGATIWAGLKISGGADISWFVLLPLGLVAYGLLRVVKNNATQ